MLDLVRMHADRRIDERKAAGQGHRRSTGRQVAADGNECRDAHFLCAGNGRVPIVVIAGVIQMSVCVDQHSGVW